MKAYAYLRVSGLGQVEGNGFERQISAILDYAKAHDLEIEKFYREEGISGTSDSAARPAMRALLEDALAGTTRTIIIERLDRLARDAIIQEGIVAKMLTLGCTLISTAEPDLCSDDPTRRFIRIVLGAVAGLDRELTVAKLRHARQAMKAANGKCEGRKSYGEKPGEDVVLRELQSRAGYGISAAAMAEDLNLRGIKPRAAKQWRASTIRKILKRARLARKGDTP
jgi:DNA invertase Pin-like site-specific DNA recombinase